MNTQTERKGPHFLGIGCMRSGTTWLFQMLQKNPNIWMPPLKELRYFDNLNPAWFFRYHLKTRLNHVAKHGYKSDAEMKWDLKFFGNERNDSWYCSLFDAEPGIVTGEITPDYCVLPEPIIDRICNLLPDTKFILLLRNPIDRAWSQVAKNYAMDQGVHLDSIAPQVVWDALCDDLVRDRNNYLSILDHWQSRVPAERLLIGFNDEIEEAPGAFLYKVLRFLNVPNSKEFIRENGPVFQQKVYSTKEHNSGMPAEFRRNLYEQYLGMMVELNKRVGGPVKNWIAEGESLLGHAYTPPPTLGESKTIAQGIPLRFLGLGGANSGASWLRHQLGKAPGIYQPKGDDVHFWDWYGEKGLPWYGNLFADASPKLACGEITSSYGSLKPAQIQQIHELFPDLRFLYIAQNPVERAWAQALKDFARIYPEKSFTDDDLNWFIAHVESESSLKMGDCEKALRQWTHVYPREQFWIGLHDEIANHPRKFLKSAMNHLEVDPQWLDFVSESELSEIPQPPPALPLPDSLRGFLVKLYSERIEKLSCFLDVDLSHWLKPGGKQGRTENDSNRLIDYALS